MTQVGERVAVPGSGASETQTKPKKCKWKNCDGKHLTQVNYPDDGDVTRKGTLRGTLTDNEMEPWRQGRYGVPDKPIYLGPVNSGGKVILRKKYRADGSMYRIEAHHLIPVEKMGATTTLKVNAKLAGWDIDDVSNGIMLPADSADVAIHELQQHDGSHCSSYTTPIKDILAEIEQRYETACHGKESPDFSRNLKAVLSATSAKIRRKILAIRRHASGSAFWPLHNNSLVVFKDSVGTHCARSASYAQQKKTEKQSEL